MLTEDYHGMVVDVLDNHRKQLLAELDYLAEHSNPLTQAAMLLVRTLYSGHKVLVIGNGGSAAEAQHFAAELVGRFKHERGAYAAIALTADSAILTALANDYGYQDIFVRQIQALGQPNDLLLAFSTSGESENVISAAIAGRECRMSVIAVTGARSSRLDELADISVRVPGADTATSQELHMVVTHVLCEITEFHMMTYEREKQREASEEQSFMALEEEEWQQ